MQYFLGVRPEVFALLDGPSDGMKVLEVGCGAGRFRDHFGTAVEYWGVEPDQEAAAIAARSLQFVLSGLYQDVVDSIPDAYFDLIICNDVIEHMADHVGFLHDIKRKLANGGRLLGSIPNIRHNSVLSDLLFRGDWPYQRAGILDRTHLRFFTRKSLLRCFDETGYELLRIKGVNSRQLSIAWCRRHPLRTLIIFFMGRDTRHLQFAFLVTPRPREVT